jgi:hypothetical protein
MDPVHKPVSEYLKDNSTEIMPEEGMRQCQPCKTTPLCYPELEAGGACVGVGVAITVTTPELPLPLLPLGLKGPLV